MSPKLRLDLFFLVLLALPPGSALFAAVPDAGSIQRDIGDLPSKVPSLQPRPRLLSPEAPPVEAAASRKTIFVNRFVIEGATLLTVEVLQHELFGFTGRNLTIEEMNSAADRISATYAKAGYLARIIIPQQEVQDGAIRLVVVEAKLGRVEVQKAAGVRFSSERATAYVTSAQPVGAPIRIAELERGLGLLQNNAGFRSSAIMQIGKAPETSDAVITLEKMPLFDGSIGTDNFGGSSTGIYRTNASLDVNSPCCIGDRLSLRGMRADGVLFGRAVYTRPIGISGLQAGLSTNMMGYTLGGNYTNLDVTGDSFSAGTFVTLPLIFSRTSTLFGTIGFDQRLFTDRQHRVAFSDKRVNAVSVTLSGGWSDAMLKGAYTSAGATLTMGNLDLSRVPDAEAQDLATARASGQFRKLSVNLSRMQKLESNRQLVVTLSGQLASGNLDSSEKFSLGGSSGVRAYPGSEASGDNALLGTVELRHQLTPALRLFGFYDRGIVQQYSNTWGGWQSIPGEPNTVSIDGAGLGMLLKPWNTLSIKSTIASRVVSNPGANAQGKDHDGTRRDPRFWLEAEYSF